MCSSSKNKISFTSQTSLTVALHQENPMKLPTCKWYDLLCGRPSYIFFPSRIWSANFFFTKNVACNLGHGSISLLCQIVFSFLFFPVGHENTNLNLLVSVWWLLLQTHHHQHQEEDPRPKTQKAAHSPWCLTNSFRTRVAGGLSRKTHRSPIGLKNQRPLNFNFGA